jgi:hypothetical protein
MLALLTTCHSGQGELRGYLGESPSRLEARLHVSLSDWSQWVKDSPYESACDLTARVNFFGESWVVCAIRSRDRIVGVELHGRGVDAAAFAKVKEKVAREYGLENKGQPDLYSVESDGSVVRLRQTPDGETKLTVTDGEFGKVYAAQALKEGLGNFERALTPH